MKRMSLFRIVAICMATSALCAQAQTVNVVEYRNKTLDAYFITGRVNEQVLLDTVADFARTGMTFQATSAASAAATLTKICRFYVNVTSPFVNSHFYGRQGVDCESILAANPAGFTYEGYDFALQTPTAAACPAGTTTVYRSFRALAGGKTSNHRYTVSAATYAAAASAGYVGEGAAFCATAATDAASGATATATAVGTATGSVVTASIGAAGGSLTSGDGRLTVTVPAGALAANTTIGIQPISNFAHGKVGAAYRLTPDGQTFLKPVTLTFGYSDDDVLGTAPEFLGAAFQTTTGFWQWFGPATINATNKTVSVNSTHFTDVSRVKALQIRPARKTVRPNATVALQVRLCYQVDSGDLTALGYECDSDQGPGGILTVDQWSVNGVLRGSGAFGTVVGSGTAATYTAPASKPTPPTVAVSARVRVASVGGSALVVSNITIAEDSWTGTATSTFVAQNVSADIIWTLDSTVNNVSTYRSSGAATISGGVQPACIVTPSTEVIDSTGVLVVDYNATPPTYFGGGSTSWPASLSCPPVPGSFATTVTALYLAGRGGPSGNAAAGSVTANGGAIEGTDSVAGAVFNWKFTRNQ